MSTGLAPHIVKYLQKLNNDRPELQLSVTKLKKTNKNYKHSNCFTLQIPYCTHILKWEIHFSLSNPERIPNIITPHFLPNILKMNSFQKFVWTNTECFSSCIQELLLRYRKYHESRIPFVKNETVHFEFETMQKISGMEYFVSKDLQQVIFKTPLVFDGMEDFFRYHTKPSTSNDLIEALIEKKISLLYLITVYEGDMVPVSKIYIHPLLQEPAYISSMKLPTWTVGQSCLMEFITEVQTKLAKVVESNLHQYKIRKTFITKFNEKMKYFLSYDNVQFYKASYLCHVGNFRFFLFLTLKDTFPKDRPTVHMQSVQHIQKLNQGESFFPVKCKLQSFEYSETTNVDIQIERIIQRVADVSEEFQRICVEINGK